MKKTELNSIPSQVSEVRSTSKFISAGRASKDGSLALLKRPEVEEILNSLTAEFGEISGVFKPIQIERKITRVMEHFHCSTPQELLEKLSTSREVFEFLIHEFTVHHTYFFREYQHFLLLKTKVLPELVQKKAAQDRSSSHPELRVLSAASSTGEEAYSLSMWLDHVLSSYKLSHPLHYKVIGIDIDRLSIERARQGIYRSSHLDKVPSEFQKYFLKKGEFVEIDPKIKDHVTFETANLLQGARFFKSQKKFDLIFCRNVFIYFSQPQMMQAAEQLLDSLDEGGFLFLGVTERLSIPRFEKLHFENSIYRKSIVKEELKSKLSFSAASSGSSSILKKNLLDTPKEEKRQLATLKMETNSAGTSRAIERQGLFEKAFSQDTTKGKTLKTTSRLQDALLTAQKKGGMWERNTPPLIKETKQEVSCTAPKLKPEAVLHEVVVRKKENELLTLSSSPKLIVIGASTGGVDAIFKLLKGLSGLHIPPILVVQHIPPVFSTRFAQRLDEELSFTVKEAVHGEALRDNTVFIAPGDFQMRLQRASLHVVDSGKVQTKDVSRVSKWFLQVRKDPPVNRHRPSVDYLFRGVAKQRTELGAVIAILLTGMGNDGALGIKELRDQGATTIGQDEKSSVVYGMARVARQLQGIQYEWPLEVIRDNLKGLLKKASKIA